jgi:hypothetical protein
LPTGSLETPIELRFLAAGQQVQQFDRCRIQATECFLLNPVGDHPRDQVFGESTRRDGSKCHPPLFAQLIVPSERMRSISASMAAGSARCMSGGPVLGVAGCQLRALVRNDAVPAFTVSLFGFEP